MNFPDVRPDGRFPLSRRNILRGLGAGMVLSVGGGWVTAGQAQAQSPANPWGGWQALPDATAHPDPRVRAVAYGILCPNAQNLQPWRIRLVGDDTMLLYMDLSRRLPVSDLPDRQLTVSFGTFTELARVGATVDGYRLEITPFPEGEPEATLDARPLASIRFVSDAAVSRDQLVDQVLVRSTNRTPFDRTRKVTPEQIAQLKAAAVNRDRVQGTADPAQVERIRDIVHRAYVTAMGHEGYRRELINYTRIGRAEAVSYAWGPASLGPAIEQGLADGTLVRSALEDPESERFQAGMASYLAALDTAVGYVWVLMPDNSRRSMFDGGREWARLHLNITAAGLKLQPHSQSLMDFAEIEPLKAEIHNAVGAKAPERLQMLGRIGYASDAPHSPREPISARLLA
ncbi:hypothetical protein [Methylocella sp.]|uniref:hypothetical protein n=1 Tax=Methylocella sp. TaxID=1978226 RepID=UPI003784D564